MKKIGKAILLADDIYWIDKGEVVEVEEYELGEDTATNGILITNDNMGEYIRIHGDGDSVDGSYDDIELLDNNSDEQN